MLITGLALGAVLGFVMQRGRFCVTGFLRDIFLGKLKMGLIHPYPAPDLERPAFKAFYAQFEKFLREEVDPVEIDETGIRIGDRFRFGTALIEASQPRQPCATIERHLQRKGIVKAIVESGRCGIFFRVLEAGVAQAGDALDLIERGTDEWTVRRAFQLVYGVGKPDLGELDELAVLPAVSDRLVHDIRRKFPRSAKISS